MIEAIRHTAVTEIAWIPDLCPGRQGGQREGSDGGEWPGRQGGQRPGGREEQPLGRERTLRLGRRGGHRFWADSFYWATLLFALFIMGGCSEQGAATEGTEIGVPVFHDATQEAGLAGFKHETGGFGQSLMPEIVGGGGGFIDYNGDGWEDIVLVAGGKWSHHELNDTQCLYLYHNNGDGTFTDVTEAVGLDKVRTYGFGSQRCRL